MIFTSVTILIIGMVALATSERKGNKQLSWIVILLAVIIALDTVALFRTIDNAIDTKINSVSAEDTEIKEVTIEDIEQQLGYKIKLVK